MIFKYVKTVNLRGQLYRVYIYVQIKQLRFINRIILSYVPVFAVGIYIVIFVWYCWGSWWRGGGVLREKERRTNVPGYTTWQGTTGQQHVCFLNCLHYAIPGWLCNSLTGWRLKVSWNTNVFLLTLYVTWLC